MVASRVHPVRHVVADHPVLHPFLEFLVEVLEDDLANGLDGLASVFGSPGKYCSTVVAWLCMVDLNGSGSGRGGSGSTGRRSAVERPTPPCRRRIRSSLPGPRDDDNGPEHGHR